MKLAMLAIACILGTGCGAGNGDSEPPPVEKVVTIFSHARHGAARMAKVAGSDEDAQCAFCHGPEKGGKRLANPPENSCYASGCHTAADRKQPTAESCGLCHLRASGQKLWTAATEIVREPARDQRFFHDTHKDEHCASCHAVAATPAAKEDPGHTAPGLCASCHGAMNFSHETHVVGAHLKCQDCHAAEKAGSRARVCGKCGLPNDADRTTCERCGATLPAALPEKAGVAILLPTHKACYQCHPGLVAETPNKDCAYCHDKQRLDLDGPRVVPRMVKGDLIGFSHQDHAKASCETCHADAVHRRVGVPAVVPTMEGCRTCHAPLAKFEGKTIPSSCATCHARLRGPQAPPDHGDSVRPIDHDEAYRRHHGEAARQPGNKCFECHDLRDSCQACHAVEPPMDHTLRFRRTEHGNQLDHDRHTCILCHQAQFCNDCHSLQAPPDHLFTPKYEVPGTGHKLAARRDQKRCYVCHAFASDCAQCHP